jgi:hypothetical protein
LIFFIDYNDQYPGFNYLEAAPTDGVFASSAAIGLWAGTVVACTGSVTQKALTSNVALLTTASAHGLSVGASVTITGVDETFNGTYTITAVPSTTTFSYAKTASNVIGNAIFPLGFVSNLSCQRGSIYSQTGVALAQIRGLHRGLFGGQAATDAIVAKHGDVTATPLNTYAAGVADSYTAPVFNGVARNDYYLPTRDELNLMLENLANVGVGGFAIDGSYWSSSESGAAFGWTVVFSTGNANGVDKTTSHNVRPVRRF